MLYSIHQTLLLYVAMQKYWFKPKRYGYGFVPVTTCGWLATLALLAILLFAGYTNGLFAPEEVSIRDGLRYMLDIFMITALFTILCKDKVEGGLAWRWGGK